MDSTYSSSADELLRNAELRTELEPYADDSLTCVNSSNWTLRQENQYLSSMLRWEKAPILPIYQWFAPDELVLPAPQTVCDDLLPPLLNDLARKLYEKHIVLDYTDHLSDRELYEVILYKILPQNEKKIELPGVYRHWDCSRVGDGGDELDSARDWLTYYASDVQRECWKPFTATASPKNRFPVITATSRKTNRSTIKSAGRLRAAFFVASRARARLPPEPPLLIRARSDILEAVLGNLFPHFLF